ncbi:ESCRT-I complex subunit [Hyphodiscus hymeniophilus]|uniref:ESCRT-I complex subunit n=1 Tax=Hyphodiscus hymeniophilus TaxID=353542 RepID=A0A9P6VRM7_9HELO|nr:ESCRT-I complex subunit [Hyphodiscus hymeniophilus]
MAAVKQQVLNWLYSVLTSEYKDVNRTYNDVAQTLSHYSSLSPRTDVYTYDHGASALLVHLSGTLPVIFRGTTYRFPIALWVPHNYPHEPPLAYVTPVEGMMVRPGQHVDPQGKIYHPYLVGWAEFWDKSNILDFLTILRDIFAKEPPVISRQQQNGPTRQQPAQIPPPIPPLPPGIAHAPSAVATPSEHPRPPPPPPKPTNNPQSYPQGGSSRRDGGPPLPPLPQQASPRGAQYGPPVPQPPNGSAHPAHRSSSLRYESAPALPPQPQRQQAFRDTYNPSPVSPITPHEDQYRRSLLLYNQSYQQPQITPQTGPPLNQQQYQQQMPPSYHQQQQAYPGQPPQWHQYPPPNQHQLQLKPPPPPDLMDGPLTLPIPSQASTNLPAPPIPPNPEKDMLLHKLGQSLVSQRQHTRTQTISSLPGLESQHKAMLNALNNMQAEIQSLESLSSLLNSNTNILHKALHDADAVIESSQHRTAPNIDEILVAPTVVGNQLYELVCEERSLGDALFVLGRAVERGVVSPAVFAKMTRTLAREWYLKKALAKKIGRGMGLAVY